jgi:hypothetical protein
MLFVQGFLAKEFGAQITDLTAADLQLVKAFVSCAFHMSDDIKNDLQDIKNNLQQKVQDVIDRLKGA